MKVQFGVMNRGQFPLGDDPRERFEEMVEQVRAADRLGFDSIMKGSHYSAWPLLDFQQFPFMARMMAEGPNLRWIAGIVLLSLHKPLDIAEQFANLDVICNGKSIFGVGLGYRDVEFRAFGLTKKDSVRRFNENLEAIKRLWTEEKVSMTGSHFELVDASCPIKPLQKPLPPIWVGANADKAIERAARVGDAWFINPHARVDTVERQVGIYRRALEAAGKTHPPAEFPMMREAVVAETHDKAMRMGQPYLEAKYGAYHEWGQDKVMTAGDNDLGLAYDELVRDRFLIGTPEEVAGDVVDLIQRFGVNHFVFGVQFPGMPQQMVLDQMQMLAEEVFPRVRKAVGDA